MTEIKTSASSAASVQIADEVISIIAGTAALEIDGVAGMVGNLTGDIAEILGKKNLSKGVSVTVIDGDIFLSLDVIVKFGYKIGDVCENIQKRVKTAIETMTGLNVVETNINITGMYFVKDKRKDSKNTHNE